MQSNYKEALARLVEAGARAGIPIAVESCDSCSASVDIEAVFGSRLAEEIRQHGYIKGFCCGWTAGDMTFYGLAELAQRQREYFSGGRS